MSLFFCVGLHYGQAKEEFNKIQLELADLSTKFSNNVLDATKAFSLTVTDKADVEGLPASALALAAQSAKVRLLPWKRLGKLPGVRVHRRIARPPLA